MRRHRGSQIRHEFLDICICFLVYLSTVLLDTVLQYAANLSHKKATSEASKVTNTGESRVVFGIATEKTSSSDSERRFEVELEMLLWRQRGSRGLFGDGAVPVRIRPLDVH